VCLLALAGRAALAADADPCNAFSWNIAHERALFASTAQPLVAGRATASTPLLTTDRLYELQLAPQSEVKMVLPPGRNPKLQDGFAGMVRLQLPHAGTYRISLDTAAWVDVIGDGQMINSADFQGHAGCRAPHKMVQYVLPAAHAMVLQISDAAGPALRLTITAMD
jgi:hypothetical protein